MQRRNLEFAEVVMKTEHLFVCVVAASISLIACASKEQSEPLTPASREMESSEAQPAAEDKYQGSEPRQCVSHEDCGKGYVCGFDPSISNIVRHCMAE
jgi:hypothetical protein